MKTAILVFVLTLAVLAAGCAKAPEENKNANPNYAATETPQSDGSVVTATEAPNGIKSEVRYFPTGDVAQVTRATRPDGRRYATVNFRDGRTVDLRDPADIDRALEASNAELAAAALKAMGAGAGQPVIGSDPKAETKDAKKGNE